MSNVNLRKDLELWVDFSERYWNPQTNRIQDQSGYGRHPEASGGPTLGAEGPNDFGAASFDGSDDELSVENTISLEQGEAVSFAILYNPNDIGNNAKQQLRITVIGDLINFIHGDNTSESNTVFGYDESTAIPKTEMSSADNRIGKDNLLVGRVDPDNGNISGIQYDFNSGDVVAEVRNDSWDGVYDQTTSGAKFGVGESNIGFGNPHMAGDVSFTAVWKRIITDAEIEALNRLTAPRRSQL